MTCNTCERELAIDAFPNSDSKHPTWRRGRCRPCRNAAQKAYMDKNPKAKRKKALDRIPGATLELYEELRVEQDYRCAICGLHETENRNKRLHFDHCHDSLAIRGLLCTRCNTALGLMLDDPARLRAAAAYLHKE